MELVLLAIGGALDLCLAKGGGGFSGGGYSSGGFSGGSFTGAGHISTVNRGGGSGESVDSTVPIVVIAAVYATVICGSCCCIFCTFGMKFWAFESKTSKAENDIINESAPFSTPWEYNGNITGLLRQSHGNFRASYYDSSYNEGRALQNSNGKISFDFSLQREDSSGAALSWRPLSGSGFDSDGSFQIKRGKVSIHTGKACWVESGWNGRTLVTGQFIPGPEGVTSNVLSFQGKWNASNGASGKFETFDLTMDSTTLMHTGGDSSDNAITAPEDTTVPSIFRASHKVVSLATTPTASTTSMEDSSAAVPSIFRAPK